MLYSAHYYLYESNAALNAYFLTVVCHLMMMMMMMSHHISCLNSFPLFFLMSSSILTNFIILKCLSICFFFEQHLWIGSVFWYLQIFYFYNVRKWKKCVSNVKILCRHFPFCFVYFEVANVYITIAIMCDKHCQSPVVFKSICECSRRKFPNLFDIQRMGKVKNMYAYSRIHVGLDWSIPRAPLGETLQINETICQHSSAPQCGLFHLFARWNPTQIDGKPVENSVAVTYKNRRLTTKLFVFAWWRTDNLLKIYLSIYLTAM